MADKFTQFAAISCTESAPNTLTFQKLETGYNLNARVGWVIQHIQWMYGCPAADFADEGDLLEFALTGNNVLTSLTDLTNPAMYCWNRVRKLEFTDVGFLIQVLPLVSDFSNLLGGGILVSPSPLYLAVKGTGLVNAQNVRCKIAYYEVELKPEEYVDLWQTKNIVS